MRIASDRPVSKLPDPGDRRWLIKTALSQRPWTIYAAIFMSIVFVCNATTPILIGRAIDDLDRVWLWVLLLAGLFLLNASAGWCGRWLLNRSTLLVGHDLRMAVTDRIQEPRGLAGRNRTAGGLLSVASADTQRVSELVMMTVFPVAEIVAIIYVGVNMLLISVPLGIAVLIGGPLVVWIALKAATPLRNRSGKRQRALARAAATATDVVEGLRILKGLGAVDTVRERYQKVSDAAYHKTVYANAAQARLNAITEAVGAIYVSGIAIAAGFMALDGQMSVGTLITAVGLTQFIIMPMTMLGRNLASRWASADASARRISEVLTADSARGTERDDAAVAALPAGLTVIRGQMPEALELLPRHRVVVAPHASDMFDGSVLDNVHPDHDRAQHALWVASCDDIPGGVEREVGESGRMLSGGQRQRVALARAIAAEAEALILQDPTTAVDSVTEQTIAQRVAAQRTGTTLVFTNAPAWVAVADRVEDSLTPELEELL